MKEVHFIVPGDINTRTGGYLYDKRVIEGLRRTAGGGHRVTLHSLAGHFPTPDRTALALAGDVFKTLPTGAFVVIDGLALAPLAELLEKYQRRFRVIGLVHHPLADEVGLSLEQQRHFFMLEKRALACTDRIVVTSHSTARELANYDVEPSRIGVVEPGTDRPAYAEHIEAATVDMLMLLCVAALIPRKGHRILVDALARLRGYHWRLICIGSLRRSSDTVAELTRMIKNHRLDGRVTLAGEIEPQQLGEWYRRADIFVLPSLHEGYGMALSEALAYGLPIVSTRVGAIMETVPGGTGILVPPGSSEAFAEALTELMDDPEKRQEMGRNAFAAGERLPSWTDAARHFATEIERSVSLKKQFYGRRI